jgi:hypothetical protein
MSSFTPTALSTPTPTTPARVPARPSRGAQDSFDGALRRAGERPSSTDDDASVHDDDDDNKHENLLATAVPARPLAAPLAAAPAGGLTAAPASLTDAAVALRIAQPTWSNPSLPPGALGAVPQAWSVHLNDTGLPIQQLNMQRLTAGPHAGLHLSLSTSTDTRRLPLDRLRERLAAKGQAPQSLSLHPQAGDAAQDAQDPV